MGAIDKLKELKKIIFNEEEVVVSGEVSETVESKFVSATLEDGTSVEIEPALEVGAAVVVIDAEGNPIAAPDAEHILADGTKIITVDGIIVEVIEVEPVVEEEVEEEMQEDNVEESQRVRKVVESIVKESHFVSEEKVNELTAAIKEEFKSELEKATKELKESMFKAFEEFSKTEDKKPTQKTAYSFQKKPSKNNFTF